MPKWTHLLPAILLLAPGNRLAAQDRPGETVISIQADVVYGHKFGLALTYDVLQPSNHNRAAVLFMVSGGWHSSWSPPEKRVEEFRLLLQKGFTVFVVRHGSSPKFVVPECVADVRRAVRHIRSNAKRFQVDAGRLGAFGGSAGGHLSLVLGTSGDDGNPRARDPLEKHSSRVAAVVAYFPPTDLAPYLDPAAGFLERFPALKFDPKLSQANSPLHHVTADDAPSLLIHGDKDKLVPISHSRKILEAFGEKKVPSRLLVIKDAAHGFGGEDRKRAEEAMANWFVRYLGRPKTSKESSR